MQNGLNNPKLHIQKCNTNGLKISQTMLETNIKQNTLKGMGINIHIEMVTTPKLCRDCKHTIIQYSQCY